MALEVNRYSRNDRGEYTVAAAVDVKTDTPLGIRLGITQGWLAGARPRNSHYAWRPAYESPNDAPSLRVFFSGLTGAGYRPSHFSQSQVYRHEIGKVLLTFDDGPTPYTERILEVLREQNVKAAFFLIGENARNHPELVQRSLK